MQVKVKRNLNVRKLPDLTAGRIGVVLAGTYIEIDGSVKGEEIDGNSTWYFDRNQNYYWSGGMETTPAPTPPTIPLPRPYVPATTIFVDYSDWIIRDNPGIKTKLQDDAIRIAVFDSGIYEEHPDFINAFNHTTNPPIDYTGSQNINDIRGHGTHVAGLIGARSHDPLGIIGVAPKCILQNIKVIDDAGNTKGAALLEALNNLKSGEVDIVNLSLSVTYPQYKAIQNRLREISEFAVVVVAAGNNDKIVTEKDILYPAISPDVISVGAIHETFATNHPNLQFNNRVDFVLPEFYLMSCATKERGFYAEDMGSSMATAIVSGIIARIISKTSNKSHAAIKQELRALAQPYNLNLNHKSLTLIKPS